MSGAIPYFTDGRVTLFHGDSLAVLRELPAASVGCCITSPPYFGVRDYGSDGQYGLEASPEEYVATLTAVFAEVQRVLATDGTLWLNVADVYGGGGIARPTGKWPSAHDPADRTNGRRRAYTQEKCLLGIPDKLADALIQSGWVLRNRIAWVKQRPVPSSGTDRLDSQYEPVFLFVKRDGRRPRYWFDKDATDSRGDVWNVPVSKLESRHYATFPAELAERCIAHGAAPGSVVLDPFSGSGTTGVAAIRQGRKYVGIDLSADYLALSLKRLAQPSLDLGGVA